MNSTATAAFRAVSTPFGTSDRPGFWTRFYRALIASREAQARHTVAAQFARMSDQRLADIGLDPEQVRQVRATGRIPVSYWS